jgi:hypothetical protein
MASLSSGRENKPTGPEEGAPWWLVHFFVTVKEIRSARVAIQSR